MTYHSVIVFQCYSLYFLYIFGKKKKKKYSLVGDVRTFYLRIKKPLFDVYVNINLIVTWSNRKALWFLWDLITWPTKFISPYTPKNGILFVTIPFEPNLIFSRRQIRLSMLDCIGDLDNASLSKWRYKMFTCFLIISYLLFVKHRYWVWKFKSIDIWNYLSVQNIEFNYLKRNYVYCLQNNRSCDADSIWSC